MKLRIGIHEISFTFSYKHGSQSETIGKINFTYLAYLKQLFTGLSNISTCHFVFDKEFAMT